MLSDIASKRRASARNTYLAARRLVSRATIEWRLGVETAQEVGLADLGLDPRHRVRYEPSNWWDLRRILRPGDVTVDDVFADLGSGKGRVVLQAARYPFSRIIGVELSPRLSAIAASNVEACRSRRMRCSNIDLVTSDVLDYELPADVSVIYLYNPFRGPVFEALADKLIRSMDDHPRDLRVIYRTPLEQDVLARSGRFELVRSVRGLRPGRAWSEKMAIHLYRVVPHVDSAAAGRAS